MTCCASGQNRSAPGGVWVQGGGIEIPCVYEIGVKKGLRSLRKELRDKLIQLVPTTDNTIQEDIRSPPMSQLKHETGQTNFVLFVYGCW